MLSRHDFLEVLDRTLDLGGDGSLTTVTVCSLDSAYGLCILPGEGAAAAL
jgi:hypothetical protein